MIPSARDIAVWALSDGAGNISASLDRLLGPGGLSSQDRALAHELALGACKFDRGRLLARGFMRWFPLRKRGFLKELE